MSWLDSDDFPSGPGGGSVDQYSTWVHPNTQAVYFWDVEKNSWKTLSSPGARMFTDTVDPGLNGYQIQDGDMWWDSRALELRVYHKPPKTPEMANNPQGRWVSSTNPEMTLEDTNRNMIIGMITIDGSSSPYEEEEVIFTADRPYGGAPESKIEYEWRSSPPDITVRDSTGQEVTYTIAFGSPNQKETTVRFPQGTAVFDGAYQVAYNISCRITAIEEFEDEFVNPVGNSPSITVRPLPLAADPIQYINMASGLNALNEEMYTFTNGSTAVTPEADAFVLDFSQVLPNFFVVPTATVGDRDNHEVIFSTKPPSANPTVNDIVSSYQTDYGPIDGIAGGNATGYILQISHLDPTVERTIYVYNELDPTVQGTIILRP